MTEDAFHTKSMPKVYITAKDLSFQTKGISSEAKAKYTSN